MKYRLLALDLDGTLLGPDHRVSAANRTALRAAQDAGVALVVSTGRNWRESREPLAGLEGLEHGVFNSGAVIAEVATGRALDLVTLAPGLALELVEALADEPRATMIHQDRSRAGRDMLVCGGPLCDAERDWVAATGMKADTLQRPTAEDLRHTLRLGLVAEPPRAAETEDRLRSRFNGRISLHRFEGVVTAGGHGQRADLIEIFAPEVDKWRGLAWLADHYGVAPDETAAIGDSINDLAMLEQAGLGVAMGDASPEAKAAADVQTRACAEDGVAYAIEQMLEGAW